MISPGHDLMLVFLCRITPYAMTGSLTSLLMSVKNPYRSQAAYTAACLYDRDMLPPVHDMPK